MGVGEAHPLARDAGAVEQAQLPVDAQQAGNALQLSGIEDRRVRCGPQRCECFGGQAAHEDPGVRVGDFPVAYQAQE